MKRQRVLLADPDSTLRAVYQRFLAQEGYEVAVAADGLECVAQLRRFGPDLLVLDPELPWGRGEGVLAMMYEDPAVPVIPVMVVTNREDPDGLHRVGVFPVSAYHIKPLEPPLLAEDVRRLLRKHCPPARTRRVDVY